MKQDILSQRMKKLFQACMETRKEGQKEYAHDTNNAFRNFESLAKELNLDRKQILWVYFKKHLDGILAAINGHTSQREPVRGRIKDAIVYLVILEGMFYEDDLVRENTNKVVGSSTDARLGTQQDLIDDLKRQHRIRMSGAQ